MLCAVLTATFVFADNDKDNKDKADPAEKALIAAGGLYERGLFEDAIGEYQQFLDKYKNHKDRAAAHYGLGLCHYQLGAYDKCLDQLDEALRDNKFESKADALAVAGHAAISAGEHKRAIGYLDNLIRHHGGSEHVEMARLNRAQAQYMLGEYAECLKGCDDFLKKYKDSTLSAAAMYFAGLCHAQLKQHEKTIERFAELRKRFPRSPYDLDALTLSGHAHESLGQLDEATKQYEAALEKAPDQRKPQLLLSLGVIAYKSDKYDAAMQRLGAVVKDHKDSNEAAPARLQLGLAQLAAGKIDDARNSFSDVVKSDERRRDRGNYWLAQCDYRQNRYEDARKRLDQLAKGKLPDHLKELVHFDRALCALHLEQYKQAAGEFGDFVNRYKDSDQAPDAAYRQAFALHKLEQYENSLKICRDVAKNAQGQVQRDAGELAAENLLLLAKYEEAADAFDALVKSTEDELESMKLRLRSGRASYFGSDFDRTVNVLKPIVEHKDRWKQEELRRAVFLTADALLQQGKHKEAVNDFARYVSLDRDDVEARYKLGLAQLRSGDTKSASKTLQDVARGKTDSPWVRRALLEYGQLLHEGGDSKNAAQMLQRLLGEKQTEPELAAPALYLLAWIDYDAKRFDEAAKRFEQVASKYPEHNLADESAFRAAVAHREAGRDDVALKQLEAYANNFKGGRRVTEARYLIGALRAELGKHGDAIKELAQLAGDDKTRTAKVLYELAWAYRAAERNDDAVKTYQQLIERFGNDPLATPARAELADLLFDREQYADAVKLLEQVLSQEKLDPAIESTSRYRLGAAYVKLARHEDAAKAFGAFAEANPKDELTASALYQAGVAQVRAGRYADAESSFAKLVGEHRGSELLPTALLRLGEVRAERDRFDESRGAYEQFLKEFSDHELAFRAHFGIGWAQENRGKHDEARKAYESVVNTHNGETAARAQFQIGETYMKQRKYREAIRELLKVDIVYDYPTWSARALYDAGQSFEGLKDKDKAVEQYRFILDRFKDSDVAKLAQQRVKALGG